MKTTKLAVLYFPGPWVRIAIVFMARGKYPVRMQTIQIRPARVQDVFAIIALLADDPLGRQREKPELPIDAAYLDAFSAITADGNQRLVVAEEGSRIVGTLQLTFLPGLSWTGSWRGQIEGVRVAADHRNSGLGRHLLEWAIEQCRARRCLLVQLTTDKSRRDAHRFYDRLGFTASHLGYKLKL